ncbi:MAG: 3-oxoacyl-[acyl-carrier-protein] synthase-1 [Gammaproteobacteria bacterium]|jgi:3-oxoacyl-[acyl-carrier-protein] synthase-1
MKPASCYLNALGMLCSIGGTIAAIKKNLRAQKLGLTLSHDYASEQPLPIGLYQGELPTVPLAQSKWQSRNNQFAFAALSQIRAEVDAAIATHGAHRIAVIVGTSTSGIDQSERAVKHWVEHADFPPDYDYGMHEMGATAQFVAETLGVTGPTYGISTACSSGAKAIASARRLIQAGLCDAVIAGGVDTLCKLTVLGFSSLEAVSDQACNPFSNNRNGISIGEAAALFLISADPKGVELCGVGEGSDAHHISAPDPTGAGAVRCMTAALKDASLKPEQLDYINLHGTATALNDQMESLAVNQVFGTDTACSSTKPFTGHTLGAAGAVEAGICWLCLQDDDSPLTPVQLWDGEADPALPALNFVTPDYSQARQMRYALSNSFAFGGNNISLLLGRI